MSKVGISGGLKDQEWLNSLYNSETRTICIIISQ
jgi:hypothetical protein